MVDMELQAMALQAMALQAMALLAMVLLAMVLQALVDMVPLDMVWALHTIALEVLMVATVVDMVDMGAMVVDTVVAMVA
jgi:hypothetical protein